MLSANEDIQDAPRDDLISPRTEEVVPALFSLNDGASLVLDGVAGGGKAQPEAEVLEKHSDQPGGTSAAAPESAPSSSVQPRTHTVEQPAAEDASNSEAQTSYSAIVLESVAVASTGQTAAPAATGTAVLRKASPRKGVPARSAEKGDGLVFIPASSLFPAATPKNTAKPV